MSNLVDTQKRDPVASVTVEPCETDSVDLTRLLGTTLNLARRYATALHEVDDLLNGPDPALILPRLKEIVSATLREGAALEDIFIAQGWMDEFE